VFLEILPLFGPQLRNLGKSVCNRISVGVLGSSCQQSSPLGLNAIDFNCTKAEDEVAPIFTPQQI